PPLALAAELFLELADQAFVGGEALVVDLRQLREQLLLARRELLRRGDEDLHDQIAFRVAAGTREAGALHHEGLAGLGAGGNLDLELLLLPDRARAAAGLARLLDDLSRARATGTGRREGENALAVADDAATGAGRAGRRLGAGLRAAPLAGLALGGLGDLDF